MEANEQAPQSTPETPQASGAEMGTFGQEEQERSPSPVGQLPGKGFADEPSSKPWQKVDAFTVVLGALMLLGIASVYVLKQNCGPAQASASEINTHSKVERALDGIREIDPQAVSRTEALVASFYYEPSRRQVASSCFEENPFLLRLDATLIGKEIADPSAENADSSNLPQGGTERSRAEEVAALEARALAGAVARLDGLKLQSTMVRPEGASTALISDFVLKTGDTIQGWKIQEVHPDRVVLGWKKFTHTLNMPQ